VLCRDGFVVRTVLAWFERDNGDGLIIFCRYERPVGLLITLYVHIVYKIALKFEGCANFPFIFHVRSADTAKTVYRHDLFQAVDILQETR
jgi:hypothetical protein